MRDKKGTGDLNQWEWDLRTELRENMHILVIIRLQEEHDHQYIYIYTLTSS